jgi:dTDP-4-amino-4,6-dideoxygalactose transaminase
MTADTGVAFLPFYKPDVSQEEIDEVVDTLRSGWLTTGPKTHAFAEAFREHVGASFAMPVSSCTAGLHLALLAAGIGPGDEVITTPFTFAATANVIVHVGATPVLADVLADDLTLDPEQVERKLTDRTKAIIPMHYAGHPCRMDELLDIARRRDLLVIEDAAHAVGSRYHGRPVGAFGDATVFSFYVTKNMTTGQGGMVTTEDEKLAEQIRLLSLHGLSSNAWDRYTEKGTWAYQVLAPGFNYVMTDIQAALGLHQLRRIDEFQRRRAELVARYQERLADLPEIIRPSARDDVVHAWHLYPVRLRLDMLRINRSEAIEQLRERGIGTSVHYIPVHLHPYYRETFGVGPGDFPVAEAAYDGLISLPLYTRMTDADVDRVSEALHEIVEAGRR